MVICDERYEFKGSYRKNGETYRDNIRKDDLPYHKGIITVLSLVLIHVKVDFWLLSRKRAPKLADWLVL